MERLTLDFLHNVVNKEEFEGNTKCRTAAYTIVREDDRLGLTYKLPLETSYTRSLLLSGSRNQFGVIPWLDHGIQKNN